MKYHLYVAFLLILLHYRTFGQQGYSRAYDFDSPGMSFKKISVSHDSLYLFGTIYHDSIPNQQGLFFAQLDTLGNLISFDVAFDSFGGDFAANSHGTIHRLNNETGYIIPASNFTRSTGMLCFINKSGEFINIVEYPDNSSLVDYFHEVIEINTGFIVFGRKQRNDHLNDLFVMKTDKQGNKIWEKYYDSPERQWLYGGYIFDTPNSLILAITDSHPSNTPMSQWSIKGILLSLDTLGMEQWRWEGENSLLQAGFGTPLRLPNGNWLYSTSEIHTYPMQNYATKKTKIVVRNSTFNLISERIFSPLNSDLNGFIDIQPTGDDQFLAVGSLSTTSYNSQPNTLAGWVYKFRDDLDSIWSREDTIFYNSEEVTEHSLSGFIQLPSGSIIAAGKVNDYSVSPGKSWGWLLKINKDGCIDTLACSVSLISAPINFSDFDLNIYPNPATETAWVETPDRSIAFVEVYDISGRLLRSVKIPTNIDDTHRTAVNTSDLPEGLYLLRVQLRNGLVTTRKLTVMR